MNQNKRIASELLSRYRCKDLLESSTIATNVMVCGWVKTKREAKNRCFIELNDGSCLANLQLVVEEGSGGWSQLELISTGASISVKGDIVESPGGDQRWELAVTEIEVFGISSDDYPLQKKRHSDEFLRQIAHLRVRTNKYGAMARIRSRLTYSVHEYFQKEGFHYVTTPIITGSDCEGAGEMFNVSTGTDINGDTSRTEFFGKPAQLTVSGQLSVESYCLALSKVYTFGPTFRAENSNTSRHISEFWMIEPEIAFATLEDNLELAADFVKKMTSAVQETSEEDLMLFSKYVDKSLPKRLNNLLDNLYDTISYSDCIEILMKSDRNFDFKPNWGNDLQTEHERFLTETYFQAPIFVIDWPKSIKPFYMRINDDRETVSSMDLLVPGIGELIGGSAREERLDVLSDRLKQLDLSEEDYWWYLDTRRFGSAPHAGFGVGFERLMMLFTGISNIRDVIPFPRTPKSLEF